MNDRVKLTVKESGFCHAVQATSGKLAQGPQAYERLRALAAHLLETQEEERQRIVAELHDGLGQTLSIINFGLEEARFELDRQALAESRHRLTVLCGQMRGALDELRQFSMDLRPSILDDFGIVATLIWFFREFRSAYPEILLRQEISISETDVPVELKTTIYRIVREAMHKIAQHVANASLGLYLGSENGAIVLSIEDETGGVALAPLLLPDVSGQGEGLLSLDERVLISNGECQIVSRAGMARLIRVSWLV
jgi:signal transduction histidine kinase